MIYLAADKHGFDVIKMIEAFLKAKKLPYENLGVSSATQEMKLEDMIPPLVKKLRQNKQNRAILSCGTGIGVEVGVNKFSGVRAVLATSPQIAEWSRVYDDCNVLCLVGWNNTAKNVKEILEAWFAAEYDGDKGRLKMFKAFDEWH